MSFSDWLRYGTVRGCLIAALVSAIVVDAAWGQGHPNPNNPANNSTSEQKQSDNPTPFTNVPDINTPQQKSEARNYQSICDEPSSRDERDLCQQWRMANATMQQVDWTKRLYNLTIYEIGALVTAVIISAVAAIISAIAAFHSSQSTTAANEANEIARKNAALDRRAWVTLDREVRCHFLVNEFTINYSWRYKLQNRGKTPSGSTLTLGAHV